MPEKERSLAEDTKHAAGKCGGFSFAGDSPDGVVVHRPLPKGVTFPNGAKAAVLLTFDVEGTYGNGIGDMAVELANYRRICAHLSKMRIPATFNVLGKMAEEQGEAFIREMIASGSEVATHGYTHDMRELGGGDYIYAGHYGPDVNTTLVRRGVEALEAAGVPAVRGVRLPYAHFNEFSYDAMEQASLQWASNVGIDDFIVAGQGFGGRPFRMTLGDKTYPLVEIPLDTQTFDWPIWIATRQANGAMVDAVAKYCNLRSIPFERSPAGAVGIWRRRVEDTIADEAVFTLLCHPINLTVSSESWGDAVDEFLLPVIEMLGEYHRGGLAWVCTCGQMADFYLRTMGETS